MARCDVLKRTNHEKSIRIHDKLYDNIRNSQSNTNRPRVSIYIGKIQKFCEKHAIKHILCPIKDHRGNGKVERLIRTINERLRANKEVFLAKDYTGLSDILFALRTAKKADGKSPFKIHSEENLTRTKVT